MSTVRTTLSSLLSVLDKGGSMLAGFANSGIDSLDMLNARIASAKVIQAKEIEEDEIYRLKEIEVDADERMTALVERADVLQETKGEQLERAHAFLEDMRAKRAAAKAAKK